VLARKSFLEASLKLIRISGYVNTDMSSGKGPKTVEEGAETPVKLAIGDLGGKTGLYWRDLEVRFLSEQVLSSERARQVRDW
jgi:hypothetical protein